MRNQARLIYDAALKAVDPCQSVKNSLKLENNTLRAGTHLFDLSRFSRIVAIGAGKASAPMAQAVEEILGPLSGLIVVKDGHGAPLKGITLCEASHPVPDERGQEGAARLMKIIKEADERTLIINLLSGGGSALLPAPAPGITLADKQLTTSLLLAAGADITQMNAVRKHLSQLKGGQMARLAGRATILNLIISDVVGDKLDTIASGPTVADSSTWQDVADIFNAFNLWAAIPASVALRVRQGLNGKIADTPKNDFPNMYNVIVASNRVALNAACAQATSLGFNTLLLSSFIEGDTKEAALNHLAIVREILASGMPLAPPACLISGGETTVVLPKDHGKGGRNQEFALHLVDGLRLLPRALGLSLGTDGNDGPTDAAGAMVDYTTWEKAKALRLDLADYKKRHDAYNFFAQTNDLIITGPTNTNVMDLHLFLIDRL